MIPVSQEWLSTNINILMLISLRIFGCFLIMPLLAFRAYPIRARLVLSLALAICLLPLASARLPEIPKTDVYLFVAMTELLIGATSGWVIRIGIMVFDLLAAVISLQTGLSYAANIYQDPSLGSGITSELLGMVFLAISFVLNIHLVFMDIIMRSFWVVPLGTWPSAWQWEGVLMLVSQAFAFGVLLSLPVIVVYFIINIMQALLVRVSPQLNLLAIGFAISVPVAFFILWIILPVFTEAIERALEPIFSWLNLGLLRA